MEADEGKRRGKTVDRGMVTEDIASTSDEAHHHHQPSENEGETEDAQHSEKETAWEGGMEADEEENEAEMDKAEDISKNSAFGPATPSTPSTPMTCSSTRKR